MNDLQYFFKIIPYEYLKWDLKQYNKISYKVISYDKIYFGLEFSLDMNKHYRIDRINITIKDNITINKNYKQMLKSSSSNYTIEPIINQIDMSQH